jgi:hypothetical protein
MKVSTENDNNVGYEKITIVVDNMPLRKKKKLRLLKKLTIVTGS